MIGTSVVLCATTAVLQVVLLMMFYPAKGFGQPRKYQNIAHL